MGVREIGAAEVGAEEVAVGDRRGFEIEAAEIELAQIDAAEAERLAAVGVIEACRQVADAQVAGSRRGREESCEYQRGEEDGERPTHGEAQVRLRWP